MLFSFLFCVNKDQPFLVEAINSMINQDYGEQYEIIIIANNCSDQLHSKIINLTKEYNFVSIFRTELGQLAFNLNYGANLAKGEYLVRMDADDVSLPNRLSMTEAHLKEHQYPDVLSGLAEKINCDGDKLGVIGRPLNESQVRRLLPFKNPIIHPAATIKKSSLLNVRGYIGGINCEDFDLWLRMDRIGMKIVVANVCFLKYRINDYQVKGSALAYADVVGLSLREALVRSSFIYFIGSVFSISKFYLLKFFGKMK